MTGGKVFINSEYVGEAEKLDLRYKTQTNAIVYDRDRLVQSSRPVSILSLHLRHGDQCKLVVMERNPGSPWINDTRPTTRWAELKDRWTKPSGEVQWTIEWLGVPGAGSRIDAKTELVVAYRRRISETRKDRRNKS